MLLYGMGRTNSSNPAKIWATTASKALELLE
jgi:hypothetical protein